MSFNLRDELKKLASTAPVLKDTEDAYSDDETRAKVDEKSTELEVENDGRRRFRPSIGDLSEYGQKYKGKTVSRKKIQQIDSEEEEEEDDADDDDEMDDEEDNDEEDNDEEDDDDDEEEEDDDDDEEEEDDEDEMSDDIEEDTTKKPKKEPSKSSSSSGGGGIDVIKFDHKQEIEKGKAVKDQLNFWEMLLESRVKLQNALNTVNQFPQPDSYQSLLSSLTQEQKTAVEPVYKENKEYIARAINQLLELQQRMIVINSETQYIVKELNLLNGGGSDEKSSEKTSSNGGVKRKRNGEGSEDDDDDDEEDEDEDDDDDDEEIYSDTDEEMRADETRKAKKMKKLDQFEYKPIENLDSLEDYLARFHQSFHSYRQSTIQKWYDKTRLITGKSFQSLEKPIIQQIEHILMDKERIIRRTQLKRSLYKICAKVEKEQQETTNGEDLTSLRERHLKDYDEEVFDDQDFYNQLLRELVERKTLSVSDPIELSRRAIELQKLRSQNKRKVDTKASKGRKIRFDIHKPMVNFMAPINRITMPEEARNELFKSLFGNHITMPTSNGKSRRGDDIDLVDFSSLFKST